jgi:hypothetical protein
MDDEASSIPRRLQVTNAEAITLLRKGKGPTFFMLDLVLNENPEQTRS